MTNNGNQGNFWTTIPGILTGVAALITAIGAIYFGVNNTCNISKPEVYTQGKYDIRPFKDFNSYDIKPLANTSQDDCISICKNNDACKGVVISPKNDCWLKYKIDESELISVPERSVIIIRK